MPVAVSHLALAGTQIRSTLAVLAELHGSPISPTRRPTFATGFDAIDRALGGGARPGELVLLGGKPGVGKTITAMHWARSMAASGIVALYVSYQHDEIVLLTRLLTTELGDLLAGSPDPSSARSEELRARIADVAAGSITLPEAVASDPLLAEAHRRVATYADRLVLAAGAVAHNDGPSIEDIVKRFDDLPLALFVDYVQKVPARSAASNPGHVDVVQRLKQFALERRVAVVGIAAADHAALGTPRLHARHLSGSSALTHEPDVIIVMNDAAPASTSAGAGRPAVVFSIEKNRNGASQVDVELAKDFVHFRFERRRQPVRALQADGTAEARRAPATVRHLTEARRRAVRVGREHLGHSDPVP